MIKGGGRGQAGGPISGQTPNPFFVLGPGGSQMGDSRRAGGVTGMKTMQGGERGQQTRRETLPKKTTPDMYDIWETREKDGDQETENGNKKWG